MGNQASSELDQTVRRLEDLKSKPDLLKNELRKFILQVPVDHTLDVRVDKKLFDIMMNLVTAEIKKGQEAGGSGGGADLIIIMQAIQRLMRVRGFYLAVPKCTVVPLIQALQVRDPPTVLATLNAIAPLLDCRCPPDKKFDKPTAELAAKQAFYESKGYDVLINRVLSLYGKSSQVAVTAKVVDMLALDLVDNCITTRFIGIQKLLTLLTPLLDMLLKLTTHPDLNIRCYGSILLQGYLLHSSLQTTQNLQSKVLEEGHLLYYILFAIDGANLPAGHPYAHQWYDKNLTELARNLLGLLCAGNPGVLEICVQKTIPKPLQLTLADIGADASSNTSISSRSKADREAIKNTLWNNFQSGRMKRVHIHPQFAKLDVEVREPHVLWTIGTKAELCIGLLKEIEELQNQKQFRGDMRWDYEGWEISYKSLDRYLRVGGFYVSLLLPVLQDKNSSYVIELDRIHMLLAALFQRSVTEDDPGWKLACLRTMSALYEKYGDQLTKDLEIIPYFAWLIDPKHTLPIYRDHILKMLQTLLKDAGNVKRFVKSGGIPHLLWYISQVLSLPDPALAKEATKSKSKIKKKKKKVVESESDEEDEEEEKENGASSSSSNGPVSPSANGNGEEGDESQTKQNLLGGLPHPLGIPETASLCLALLRLIQLAGPKMKRVMSEKDVVNTLIRLLMCPIPGVKEEGIRLLLEVLDHSTHLVPRLITTGLFSFLVYGLRYGSSPATLELLSKYHMKQDKSLVPAGESALTPYFPRALAEVLKTQGAEAFGQLFESRDGASSNAAAAGSDLIWNPQLKKHLLEVMSRRLGGFRALLETNPFAEYKFSPPEAIRYPSLESELDMAGVSLRALNETGGVPELLAQLEIPSPDELMEELVRSLNARRFAGIDLLNILTAQVILIKRFPNLTDVQNYSAWDALYEIMANHQEQEFPMIEKSAEIMHVLLATKSSPDAHPDDDDVNLGAFIETKGHVVLSKTLEYFSSLKVNNILIQRILIDLLNCVYALGIKAPEVTAKNLSSDKKFVRNTVLDFLGVKSAQAHPMLSVVTCKCLMALSLNDKFQIILLETGTILHLVDMACFYRSQANEDGAAAADANNNTGGAKGMDEEKRVRLAASSVLSLLAGFTTPMFHPDPNAQVQRIMSAMLTPDLVESLASPSGFVARVSAHRPQLQVLFKYIEGELIGVKKTGEWPQRQWPFQPLNIVLKPAPKAAGRPPLQQQQSIMSSFNSPLGSNGSSYASSEQGQSENGEPQYEDQDQQQDEEQGDEPEQEYDENGQPIPQEASDDLPDAYAIAAPQQRVLSPGDKMQEKLSDFGSSVGGAFANFRSKAKEALTPVKASASAKAQSAAQSAKGAAQSVQQSEQMQRAKAQAQAGAQKAQKAAAPHLAAAQKAAAPQLAAAQKAAAPALAAGKIGARIATQEVTSAAKKAQLDAAPLMRQASLQANKAAAAAAPKVAQAKAAAQSAQAAATPKVAAAGAAMGAVAASAMASAKNAAASASAAAAARSAPSPASNTSAAAPTEQLSYADEEADEEVHDAASFYANDSGALLSPNNAKSPSTQHTPYDQAQSASAVTAASASPQLEQYDASEHGDDAQHHYEEYADPQQQEHAAPEHYSDLVQQQHEDNSQFNGLHDPDGQLVDQDQAYEQYSDHPDGPSAETYDEENAADSVEYDESAHLEPAGGAADEELVVGSPNSGRVVLTTR